MNKKSVVFVTLLAVSLNLGMGRRSDQYDEEARQQEKLQKQMTQQSPSEEKRQPLKNFATGVKELTVDNTKDALVDTAEGTISKRPVVGTLNGAQQGSSKVVDNTIKGVKKVVSLGYATDESYEIEQPQQGSGDAAKVKLFQF